MRQAATNGNLKAQATLGGMYYSGTGVEKDAAQAIHWFTLAANQGNPVAQYDLGRIYLFDEQVKNIETGINWIEKSASLGYLKAIELLVIIAANLFRKTRKKPGSWQKDTRKLLKYTVIPPAIR